MNWAKENTFRMAVLGAVVIITVSYFYFQKNRSQEQSNLSNQATLNSAVIQPNQSLRDSFEESRQQSAMADIAELSCFPTSRFNCTSESCKPDIPATYYFVDYGTDSGTYFRCDSKGCDSYPVNVVPSGIYTQFIPKTGEAMLFKFASEDLLGGKGEFIDIATIGTASIISFGKCDPA